MDNELNDKIKEIGSLFGINEMPDNIGDIVQTFLSHNSEASETDEHIQAPEHNNESEQNKSSEDFDAAKFVEIVNKCKKAQLNKKNDKKIQLLHAIEPFLHGKRKEKISSCMKFLTFADIAKDMKMI